MGKQEPNFYGSVFDAVCPLTSIFFTAANLFPVQDHDYHHQSYVYPRRQLRDSWTDHPDSRVPIQSFETPFM